MNGSQFLIRFSPEEEALASKTYERTDSYTRNNKKDGQLESTRVNCCPTINVCGSLVVCVLRTPVVLIGSHVQHVHQKLANHSILGIAGRVFSRQPNYCI
jgi:hypothetical protein